jgi:nucleoside-diphosphate-sugar epimerase
MRAVREQLYQSERSWLVDSSKFERAFGWQATSLREAIAATVVWFRSRVVA